MVNINKIIVDIIIVIKLSKFYYNITISIKLTQSIND